MIDKKEEINYRPLDGVTLRNGDIYQVRDWEYYESLGQSVKRLAWKTKCYNTFDYMQAHTLSEQAKVLEYKNNIRIHSISDSNLVDLLDFKPFLNNGTVRYHYVNNKGHRIILTKFNDHVSSKDMYSIEDGVRNKIVFEGRLTSLNDLINILKCLQFKNRAIKF